ncbi:MAG: hypothetical protein ACOC7K_00175 [bacterium]
MLTEYALTPHLFDDLHNADAPEWLPQLRRFGHRLLPPDHSRVCNTVVSDLYGGSWYASAFVPLVEDLERRQQQDPTTRLPALDLLRALRPRLDWRLVVRPPCSQEMPDAEDAWACEAEASAARLQLPYHRLVGSCRLSLAAGRHRLQQTDDEAFWDPVSPIQTIPATVNDQVLALQRMCSFYSFLSFSSQFMTAQGGGRDLAFAIAIARRALRRHHDFSPPNLIDLHTEGTTDGDVERQQQAEAILARVRAELGPAVRLVRVFLWRDVKERRLLIGHCNGGSSQRPQVVWGVAMTHVVRPGTDDPNRDRHTFPVLDRRETSRLYSDFYGKTGPAPYPGSPWTSPST